MQLADHLRRCGYDGALLRAGYRVGGTDRDLDVPLVGFAHEPVDARSACVAVTTEQRDPPSVVGDLRELGAPIVFLIRDSAVQWWRQAPEQPQLREIVRPAELPRFFDRHARDFAPASVYRAKTSGRFPGGRQLDFVDVGLMPLVDRRLGSKLASIVESLVRGLREHFPRRKPSRAFGRWLFKGAFWLLAARILKDKHVPAFADLDLGEPEGAFAQVARHYRARTPFVVGDQVQRSALAEAARAVGRFGSLENVTTEALAYVYENALVDKDTRAELGVHSTPSYLVDYVVWRLEPWIREISEGERHVFEPASGNAGFLVAAMRLLRELLPREHPTQQRPRYLRERLHGIEIDDFALEISLLSMSLADVPHPDGWDVLQGDMFAADALREQAARSMIVLSNPPFKDFTRAKRRCYTSAGRAPHVNPATEMLARILPALRPGAVCGFVVPHGVLHDKDASLIRRVLATDFELMEICEFPDKVFPFSDPECAVVLARRQPSGGRAVSQLVSRKVRERDIERFQQTYEATFSRQTPQDRLVRSGDCDLRLRELEEVWAWCARYARLETIALIGQGLQHKAPGDLPRGSVTVSERRFARAVPGYRKFEARLHIHERPRQYWVNVDRSVIRRAGTGTTVGQAQVLLNYAPVSRGPWRLKALIDQDGHAVTSRFLTVRPRLGWPLEFFWALLNSPVANAFAFDRLAKRDVLAGELRQLPVPPVSAWELQRISDAARTYLEAAAGARALPLFKAGDEAPPEALRQLLLQVDAEILGLYDLPPRLERQLLDVFAGQRRVGVPFELDAYYPADFRPWISLKVYLSDAYQRSTAGPLLARASEPAPHEVLDALQRAVEAYED